MGKAAKRRNERRKNLLARLAEEKPEKFRDKWNALLNSWLGEIGSYGRGFIDSERIFKICENALDLLVKCGPKAVELMYDQTSDVLTTHCAKVVACDQTKLYELYRLNQKYSPRGPDTRPITQRGYYR